MCANVGTMTWTRCFSSLGCPDLPLDDIFALAARHGVSAVELRSVGGTEDVPAHFTAEYETPAVLAGRLKNTPVRIAALNASLRLIGGTAAEREQLTALAAWADALGIPRLRVFDGGKLANTAELAEAVATLRWWQGLRLERGWQTDLMVETHDSLITAEAIGRFVAAAPGTAVLWDAHHTWRKGGEDPVVTWRAIHAAVVHIHVKDSLGLPSARHPFTYVLPGDGGFPIAPLLAALTADNFAGRVSLEWEKRWHPYLPSLDEALRSAAQRRWW